MLRVTIDGREVEAEEGSSVLDAVRAAGVAVPTLCHDDRLAPYGGCRLCVVHVDGQPVASCSTPLADGVRVETHTPELERLRRTLLGLLASGYPAEAVEREPDREFHRYLREYRPGRRAPVDAPPGGPVMVDRSHPYIDVDFGRCVSCNRCVRICEEVQGQSAWRLWNRGDATRIRPAGAATLLESPCVSCGACVDTCPTGALEDRSVVERGAATAWTRTTCPYCGTGCEMLVGTRAGRIVTVRPAPDAPVNRGHLCVKGRYAFDFVDAADRVTEPMIRSGGEWVRVSWETAVERVAGLLAGTVGRHGPDSVAVLGSARATNEENYLTQKLARAVLGTNNVDCCARVCHAPTAAAMKQMLGAGAATSSFDDLERARTILVCGANVTENHPVVGARIKRAVLRGARLVVVDPRRIELARYATVHLRPRPGTNVPLLNAIANVIVEEGLADERFVGERVAEWDEYREFVRAWTPERAAAICGVEAGLVREAARLYAGDGPSICFHGLGVTEHVQGTEGVICLVNLALLTGNLGRPGAGINPLRGQNNVQGAAHMGCDPASLTGAVSVEEGRNTFEAAWGAPLPAAKGLDLMWMMEAARAGRLKGLWAIGYDVLLTNPDAGATARALEALDFVVVQDMFLTETARAYGTVFLPAASPFEKEGTFMNAERRVQRVRRAVAPRGEAKADWEILCEVARAMGKGEGFAYGSAGEIWDEIRSVWPAGRGITYERLERGGLQWPCPSERHPGTAVLHRGRFPLGARAALRRVDYRPTPETTDSEFPFLLVTGRTLHQFNAGTMTMRTPNALLRPGDRLDVAPEDADRLGLAEGERVRVRSRYGEAALPVHRTGSVRAGELFATFHTARVFLNRVTGPHRDRVAGAPEYKVTAVRIERARAPERPS